jgi:hypothetical protein
MYGALAKGNFEIIEEVYDHCENVENFSRLSLGAFDNDFTQKMINRFVIIKTRDYWTERTYQQTVDLNDQPALEYLNKHDCPKPPK